MATPELENLPNVKKMTIQNVPSIGVQNTKITSF